MTLLPSLHLCNRVSNSQTSWWQGFPNKIGQLELNTTNKFQQVSTQITDVSTRVGLVEANLGSRISRLEEVQHKDSNFPSPPCSTPSFPTQPVPSVPTYWDRIPDPTILRVCTLGRARVSLKAVEDCFLPYFVECGYHTTDSLWRVRIWAMPSGWSSWVMSPLPPGMSNNVVCYERTETRHTRSLWSQTPLGFRPLSSSTRIKRVAAEDRGLHKSTVQTY